MRDSRRLGAISDAPGRSSDDPGVGAELSAF